MGVESAGKAIIHGKKYLAEGEEKELDKFIAELVNTVGFAFGIGTPQLWRTWDGAEAYFVDERGGVLAPLLGKPQKKKKD